jgi:hypothetical protein
MKIALVEKKTANAEKAVNTAIQTLFARNKKSNGKRFNAIAKTANTIVRCLMFQITAKNNIMFRGAVVLRGWQNDGKRIFVTGESDKNAT